MENKELSLSHILHPFSVAEFMTGYYEKKTLLVKATDKDRFLQVLNIDLVSSFLERLDTRLSAVRLIKNGIDLPVNFYSISRNVKGTVYDDFVDNEKVFQHLANGASISFGSMHRSLPSLLNLCRTIGNELKQGTQTNVYLTPKSSRALKPHYDLHDIFVVQAYGSKVWRIYEDTVEFPTKPSPLNLATTNMAYKEIVLEQGDLLYLPRGVVHDAYTTGSASLHVTLGLQITTWGEVFGYLKERMMDDVEFRKPFHGDQLSAEEIDTHLALLASKFFEVKAGEKIKSEFSERATEIAFNNHHGRLARILFEENQP